ncbi:hypothetical protein T484DRAFT_1776060 [Baffinella frigidus]|nr:hypothetical protein T484DRAFT_1776060 [Cryptophyta sp. CCMP2293]
MSGPGWVGKSPTTTAFVLGMGLIGGALVGFKVQENMTKDFRKQRDDRLELRMMRLKEMKESAEEGSK